MKAISKSVSLAVASCLLLTLSGLAGCASSGHKGSGTVWDVDLHHGSVRIDERTFAVTAATKLSNADGDWITLREVRTSSSPGVGILGLDRARVRYTAGTDDAGNWVLHSLRPTSR